MIEESEIFIRQVLKLKKKYPSIEEDIGALKLELPKLSFKHFPPLNIHITTINKSDNFIRRVWRIRVINSDNNKGKRGGYRIFYCEGKKQEMILLLGIYPKPQIKDNEYHIIAKELVEASCEY